MTIIKNISLFIAMLLTVWAIGYFLFALAALAKVPERPDQPVDAIVVLTGGSGRIETGLELFAHNNAQTLFVTGVHPYVRRSEVRAMWTGDTPLPNCCIMLGYEARTTQQNAEETRDWLAKRNFDSIRLVTGNFHMSRALNEFRHALPADIEIIPHAIIQPRFEVERFNFWRMAFYEYNKSLFRWIVLKLEKYLPPSVVNLQLNPEIDLP